MNKRCDKDKRHVPHWHGSRDQFWCDGRIEKEEDR